VTQDILYLIIHLFKLFSHLVKVSSNHLLDIISLLVNFLEIGLVFVVVLKNLMILVLDEFYEFFTCFGDLGVFFHFVVVFGSGHDDDFELIVVVHPEADETLEAEVFEDGADLVAFVVEVCSLAERDDSLLVFDEFVGVDDDGNNKVDHQYV
jgi:hypothetical protein